MSEPAVIDIDYKPHPKQCELHSSPANEILYGGAAGPGKSHGLRFEGLKWALNIPNIKVYVFRRTLPELEQNHILPSKMQFPAKGGRYKEQKKYWEFKNGSVLQFGYAQYESNIFEYQGHEINLLIIDELTTFSEFMYDYLRGRVRCALPIPEKYRHKVPGIICGSNPGGVGHEFVKRRWVDFCGEEGGIKRAPDKEGGMLRQYIPGYLEDNPTLTENDPDYCKRLDALPEPYRSAYRYGKWDIFMGQMFAFNKYDHVIDPMPVPENAPLYMTFDWGFGRPYSVGWWWIDEDGRKFRFAELYGCVQDQPDTGLRQTDDEIAEEIIRVEKEQGIWGKRITRLADPTCFNKRADYKKGGQVDSTARVFGKYKIYLLKGDPSRLTKIRQFHAHLRKIHPKEGEPPIMPMLMVYKTCKNFIRTIPLLQADKNNVEDVDKKLEDHIYDEACHVLMARPISQQIGLSGSNNRMPANLGIK